MLQTLRSWAKYIWIFVIAAPFIIGFLLYQTSGLGNAAAITPSTPVAKVDGTEILYATYMQNVQSQVQSEQQSGGRSLTQDEERQIQNSVFDQMVMQILLDRQYKARGITVSDDEIREYAKYAPPTWVQQSPDLQTDGKFDLAKYQRLLASPAAREGGSSPNSSSTTARSFPSRSCSSRSPRGSTWRTPICGRRGATRTTAPRCRTLRGATCPTRAT